jgi:hypothetical protein
LTVLHSLALAQIDLNSTQDATLEGERPCIGAGQNEINPYMHHQDMHCAAALQSPKRDMEALTPTLSLPTPCIQLLASSKDVIVRSNKPTCRFDFLKTSMFVLTKYPTRWNTILKHKLPIFTRVLTGY